MKKQNIGPYFYVSLLVLAGFVTVGAGCTTQEELIQESDISDSQVTEQSMYSFPGVLDASQIENKIVRIETENGDIVFELFADTAPKTVSNFVYLANQGYFNGLTFHRRVEDFVIQGGDPMGNGMGGPGYKFEDELNDEYQYDRGIVAMANSGPDTNGSQFFIMLADNPLPKAYSIFGRVLEGMEVVDEIGIGDVMTKVTIESIDGSNEAEGEDGAEVEGDTGASVAK